MLLTMQLSDSISKHFRLDSQTESSLKRLGLEKIKDLIFYFPIRYGDMSALKNVADLVAGETATLYGTIKNPKTKKGFVSKIPMAEATFEDLSGSIKIIWFHQAYLAKMVHDGQSVKLTGKVSENKNGLYLSNPEFEKVSTMPIDSNSSLFKNGQNNETIFGGGYPVYKETKGLSSKWIYHTIIKIFKSGLLDNISEYLPEKILEKYHLPKLKTALIWIHSPKKKEDAESARKRFAFEEVFFIQLQRAHERNNFEKNNAYIVNTDKNDIENFVNRFPFQMTKSQENAINAILDNMEKSNPMARLLEGDVGSGKTAVAATSAYSVIKNRPPKPQALPRGIPLGKACGERQAFGNLQVAYMAPTEILATQHFENFIQYFKHTGISIGLITGSGCRKFPTKVASAREPWTNISRAQLLKWVANGEIPILIGTHALIQKSVKFKDLALVIVDEQHRFGALQRARLAKKENFAPHYLSMTATPIPRTLALTIYGDLDLTLLNEMPHGRKPVITEIVTPLKRAEVYEKIRSEMKNGRQLYVICPRINAPDPDMENSLQVKSVTEETKRLKKDIFPEYEIGILHSKMTKQKKEEVMDEFSKNKIDILLATSVVEVGVNVPNATIIIIEGAERFGLAQLHQLRGRVIRSNTQAYCYLFAEAKSQKTMDRLKALKTAKNGFELAELDLALRGAGELSGVKQWGISDLGMEAIKNIKMVEAARNEAQALISSDSTLHLYPKLKSALSERKLEEMHFE